MRGRSSTWTRIRVNLRNVPDSVRPRRSHQIRTTTPRVNGANGRSDSLRSRAAREYFCQFLRRHNFQLRVSAAGRRLVGGHRRNCAVCRKRSPCMWSYATSTTSSGRKAPTKGPYLDSSGSDLRACVDQPGHRPSSGDAHNFHGCAVKASSRYGARNSTSSPLRLCKTSAHSDMMKAFRYHRTVPIAASRQNSRSPFLCQRKPATTQSQSRSCFTLSIDPLVRLVYSVCRFGHDTIETRPFESTEPIGTRV